MNFGANVKKIRKKAKLTQAELAAAAGVTPSMIIRLRKALKIRLYWSALKLQKHLRCRLMSFARGLKSET